LGTIIINKLESVIQSLSSANSSIKNNLPSSSEGWMLPGLIALTAVNSFLPEGSMHKDRSVLLLKLCGGELIKGIRFTGTLARYDFSGIVFSHCWFDRVAWANCRFDDTTEFRHCHFSGDILPVYCKNFGTAVLSNCTFSPEADKAFRRIKIQENQSHYSAADLREDISSLTNKFIVKGSFGLKSVEKPNLPKGTIANSPFKDEIIDVFRQLVIEEHHISNAETGYNIRDEAADAVRFYIENNVYTGPLDKAFNRLKKKLGLK
jgi:hypothetical protein